MNRKNACRLASLLAVLTLGLAGCDGGQSVQPSSSSAAASSSTSSSTSVAPQPSKELTEDMLAEAADGYSFEAYLVNDYTMPGDLPKMVYEQYAEAQADPDYYHVKAYLGAYTSDGEEVTKDDIEQDQYYTHTAVKGKVYAAYAAIGASNTVEASQIPILWKESFANFFVDLKAEDFTKGDEEYHFLLDGESVSAELSSAIMSQLCGGWGYQLETLEIVTDGFHITELHAVSAPYDDGFGGNMIQKADATIVALGEEAFTPLKPYEGKEDADFQAAMNKLALGNYHVKEDIYQVDDTSKELLLTTEADVADGVVTIPDGGSDYYFVPRDGNLYEVGILTDQDNNYYYFKDGFFYSGCGDPTFNLSSIFFDKAEDGAYVFDAEAYPDVYPELAAIDPLDSGSLTALEIVVSEDSIVFTADAFAYSYTVTYTKIGEVAEPEVKIPEELDYCRISDVWSVNDTLLSLFGLEDLAADDAEAIIDAIPVSLFFGLPGMYTFSDNAGNKTPAIGFDIPGTTEEEINDWLDQFSTIIGNMLADDGFAIDFNTYAYVKDVQVGKDTYAISINFSYAQASLTTYIGAYTIEIAKA